jgi:hypothetical protein
LQQPQKFDFNLIKIVTMLQGRKGTSPDLAPCVVNSS